MKTVGCPLRALLSWLLLVSFLAPGLAACKRSTDEPIAAAQTATEGVVWVLSEPQGADVAVQGVIKGQTPLMLMLASGSHELELAKPGYASDAFAVAVTASGVHTVTRLLADVTPPELNLQLADTVVQAEEGLKVDARAKDNEAVESLRLYLDGVLLIEQPGDRLVQNLDTRDLEPGSYELRVVAFDGAGNSTARRAQFTVLAPTLLPPTAEPMATPTATAVATPLATVEPTASATTQPRVVAWWDELTIPTMGYQAGLYTAPERVGHPYPLLDRGAMTPVEPVTYRVLRVRNSYLDLTFLPELGGRLYQARFLPTGQDLFWSAPVIKPTHWGPLDQGWWLAVGGMEWCLPVDEHGYLTAQPWDVSSVERADGGITVSISTVEQTRNMRATIEVTLLPGEAALGIATRLENPNDAPISYQYWMNAILSPGAAGIGPDLSFIVPAERVVVHSTGDRALPGEHGVMDWPEYQGRDMSVYGNWRNWLGFFATETAMPFTALYSRSTALGMARVFPVSVAPGAKLFAFARDFADTNAYTDDGTHYAEMWGGVTRTFWEYAELAAGAYLAWEETWWVLADSGVPCVIGDDASIAVERADGLLRVTIMAPRSETFVCQVRRSDAVLFEETIAVAPDASRTVTVPLDQAGGDLVVRLLDRQGREVLACTP